MAFITDPCSVKLFHAEDDWSTDLEAEDVVEWGGEVLQPLLRLLRLQQTRAHRHLQPNRLRERERSEFFFGIRIRLFRLFRRRIRILFWILHECDILAHYSWNKGDFLKIGFFTLCILLRNCDRSCLDPDPKWFFLDPVNRFRSDGITYGSTKL